MRMLKINCSVTSLTVLHSKMFDVADVQVLIFGNCASKTGVIKWPLKLTVRTFLTFFVSNSERHDFLTIFESSRTFSVSSLEWVQGVAS